MSLDGLQMSLDGLQIYTCIYSVANTTYHYWSFFFYLVEVL